MSDKGQGWGIPRVGSAPSPVHKKAPAVPKSKSHFLEKTELVKNIDKV